MTDERRKEQSPPRLRGGVGADMPLLVSMNLETLLSAAHPIRGIWTVACALDWTDYENRLRARGSRPGRRALDPRALATLWVWGISQGMDSARALARRCETDVACMWALGGERTNHHTLSDFLRQEAAVLDELLAQTIVALHRQGVVSFDSLLVDGTKVKARASAESFGDEPGLLSGLSRRLSGLRARGGAPGSQSGHHARAARELRARTDAAVEMVRQRQASLRAQGPSRESRAEKVKASRTDASARFMRHSDGGRRPSVNVQVGCCEKSGAVLYVSATAQANDRGLAGSAVAGVRALHGAFPRRVLADGDYASRQSALALRAWGVDFLCPPHRAGRVANLRRTERGLREALREAEGWWRGLWADSGAQARGGRMRVERVIGSMKRRGLRRVPVFGLAGAGRWARWHALAHNLLLLLGIRG